MTSNDVLLAYCVFKESYACTRGGGWWWGSCVNDRTGSAAWGDDGMRDNDMTAIQNVCVLEGA